MPKHQKPLAPKISVSAPEAAEMCGLSKTTLYICMNDGRLPYVKVGHRRLILLTDLEEFLVSFRKQSCTQPLLGLT